MSCKLKVVVSLLRIIATLLSLRPFTNKLTLFTTLTIINETTISKYPNSKGFLYL